MTDVKSESEVGNTSYGAVRGKRRQRCAQYRVSSSLPVFDQQFVLPSTDVGDYDNAWWTSCTM